MSTLQILGPAPSNFVRAVMLCCEEKGVSYTVGLELNGKEVGFKSEEHFALHPYGKVPVLIHGDRTLFETAVICRYIDEVFDGPALRPQDLWERTQVEQAFAEIALYIDQVLVRNFLVEFVFPKGEDGSVRMDAVEAMIPEVQNTMARIESMLGDRDFIAGNSYSMADAILTPMLDYIAGLPMAGQLMPETGTVYAYLQRMRARPSGVEVLKPLH